MEIKIKWLLEYPNFFKKGESAYFQEIISPNRIEAVFDKNEAMQFDSEKEAQQFYDIHLKNRIDELIVTKHEIT